MDERILIYVSTATHKMNAEALSVIAKDAQFRNRRCGVSGLLLYSGSHFLQVLEGRESVLEMLYQKIRVDQRHHTVEQLMNAPLRDRIFGSWAMGVLDISQSKDLDREKFRFICDQAACDPASASRAALTVLKMFRKDLGLHGAQAAA